MVTPPAIGEAAMVFDPSRHLQSMIRHEQVWLKHPHPDPSKSSSDSLKICFKKERLASRLFQHTKNCSLPSSPLHTPLVSFAKNPRSLYKERRSKLMVLGPSSNMKPPDAAPEISKPQGLGLGVGGPQPHPTESTGVGMYEKNRCWYRMNWPNRLYISNLSN